MSCAAVQAADSWCPAGTTESLCVVLVMGLVILSLYGSPAMSGPLVSILYELVHVLFSNPMRSAMTLVPLWDERLALFMLYKNMIRPMI